MGNCALSWMNNPYRQHVPASLLACVCAAAAGAGAQLPAFVTFHTHTRQTVPGPLPTSLILDVSTNQLFSINLFRLSVMAYR
jgi:hypothetical protein